MLANIKKFISKNYVFIFLLIILVSSAFLRLYKIADYMTFLGDEGRDVLVVREILHGDLTFLGPRASAGDFYLGPIYYYFMVPFLFLSNYHPVGPAIMVALFGIATVYLVYLLGREFWDKKAGLIAASLYAVSPLVIAYSRSSWNPNLMPFFSIATLYSAYLGLKDRKLWLFILSGFFLGISMQLHYLSTFLGAILFFYILLSGFFANQESRIVSLLKQYASIVVGFIIGILPFLLFEIKNNFPNTRTIINFIFSSGEVSSGGNFFSIVADVAFRMYGRLITFYPPPERIPENPEPYIAIWFYATILLAVVTFGFSLYFLANKIKQRNKQIPKYLLIPLWLLLGIVFFGFYKKGIYDYYFGFMFPVPFLLVGIFSSYLWKKGKILMAASIVIVLSLLAINILGHPFQYQPNKQYEQVKQISEFVLDKADGKPFNFALITGGNSDHAYRYIFEVNGNHPVAIEFPGIDPERNTITDQLLVVCEQECQPLGHSLWEVAGFGQAEIEDEWQVSVVKVYKLVHYEE